MTDSPRGYYKMVRGWLDHPLFTKEPFDRRSAWAWLIEEATYTERQKVIGGKIIELKRGQLCHSYRFMAEAWGWKKDRVARYLKLLESARMIRAETTTVGATAEKVVSICNYGKYQWEQNNGATATATTTRQQRDKLEEGKEGKKESLQDGDAVKESSTVDLEVWTVTLRYLTANGVSEKQARSMIGKWRKKFTDGEIIDAHLSAKMNSAADPIPYMQKILGKKSELPGAENYRGMI